VHKITFRHPNNPLLCTKGVEPPHAVGREYDGLSVPPAVPGIHHVTSITGDVQKNVDFYVAVLGLRFVKKSINQDVPDTYHIYFGDYLGSPGTAMTFVLRLAHLAQAPDGQRPGNDGRLHRP